MLLNIPKAQGWWLKLAWMGLLVLAFLLSEGARAASAPTEGEVRRVDADGGRITLKHGPIAELELPAMTLVYRVEDRTLLVPVQPGDTVIFTAARVNGHYTILTLQPR